MKYKK